MKKKVKKKQNKTKRLFLVLCVFRNPFKLERKIFVDGKKADFFFDF